MRAVTADRRISVRGWFPFALLGWVATAGGMWYLFPGLGLFPVFIAVLPWLARLMRTGRAGPGTPFDVPLLFFLITASVSLWAAYDPGGSRVVFPMPVGRRKLWGLILGTMMYYSLIEFRTRRQRRWLLSLLTAFGVAVGLWFVATNDWDVTSTLWNPLTGLGEAVQSVLPHLPGHRLSPNVAGGLIALVLPMALELVIEFGRARDQGQDTGGLTPAVGAAVAACVMALGLLLTSSRGAWLGMGGALGLAGAWWLAGQLRGGTHRLAVFLAFLAAASLLAVVGLMGSPFLRSTMLKREVLLSRLTIFYQAAHLARDYMFTGCGLGNFPVVHATYVLLIHVPTTVFAHCTPLDVAVEQGILGAMALLVVWTGAAWIGIRHLARSDQSPTGLTAGLLSLVVLMLHGAFDSTIYGSRGLLLFWMPAGLIVAASTGREGGASQRETEPIDRPPHLEATLSEAHRSDKVGRWPFWPAGVAALFLAGLLILLWRPLAASWYANLGAVHQTRVELQAYDHSRFDDPTLDEVRQQEDLSQAVGNLERALALDSSQVTARTRLSQITLARGDYHAALRHAQAAWDAGYRDRVTRLVLGDALVAQGRIEEAARVVRGLERAQARLEGQAFYKYERQGDWQRAAYAWRTVLALDPGNHRARSAAEITEAEAKKE